MKQLASLEIYLPSFAEQKRIAVILKEQLAAVEKARKAAKEKFSEEEMSQLWDKLAFFESIIGEEYYVFVQMKTLDLMMKEINQIYNIDLGSLKSIFTRIINDEEHHREMLGTIKGILERHSEPSNTPVVKYQNPDSWISSLPPTS